MQPTFDRTSEPHNCGKCGETNTEERPGKWLHYRALYCVSCCSFIRWIAWPRDDPSVRQEFIERANAIAAEKHYQPGWVAHKYFELFGRWPSIQEKQYGASR